MMLRTLTAFCLLSAYAFSASVPPSKIAVEDLFTSIEKALKFFGEDYSSINVDGLFGLRIGEGQIREAIRECREKSCDEEILRKLTSLDEQLSTTCDSALPYVEASDPAYYSRFVKTVNKPYVIPYLTTHLDEKDEIKVGTQTKYDEELGDRCLSRLMGTFEENNKLLPACNTTHHCWDYMTTVNQAGYVITHQLLFFIITEHVGCRESVENFIKKGKIKDIQKDLCSKIYAESKQLEKDGKVKSHNRDLFLEQTLLCGPLGFENFMRPDWMKMVLTWPDKKDGCFKIELLEVMKELEEEKGSLLDQPQSQEENASNGKMTMRKLLREKEMKHGCLSHTSGLGFGTLCTYLRYLLRLA